MFAGMDTHSRWDQSTRETSLKMREGGKRGRCTSECEEWKLREFLTQLLIPWMTSQFHFQVTPHCKITRLQTISLPSLEGKAFSLLFSLSALSELYKPNFKQSLKWYFTFSLKRKGIMMKIIK